jgi:aminoglycoside 3-N-acetyltransferase
MTFASYGVRAADTLMLHASVRAVGEVAGGPDPIHLALKSVLSPEG